MQPQRLQRQLRPTVSRPKHAPQGLPEFKSGMIPLTLRIGILHVAMQAEDQCHEH